MGKMEVPLGGDCVISPIGEYQGTIMPGLIVEGQPKVPLSVVNLSDKFVTLKPGKVVGNAVVASLVYSESEDNSNASSECQSSESTSSACWDHSSDGGTQSVIAQGHSIVTT